VWSFCMPSSCKPFLCIIAAGSRQSFRQAFRQYATCHCSHACEEWRRTR
jgi:hypothetical protein